VTLIVQKYGGSSLADADGIKRVAQRIVATRKAGNGVVVVVSAMGDSTDELHDLALQVSPLPPGRELDMLLTAGERISMALVAMAIANLGFEARSFTGSQAGVITDSSHGKARIIDVTPGRISGALDDGAIPIVAGFQGVSQDSKDITTLGRGGSDTTAVVSDPPRPSVVMSLVVWDTPWKPATIGIAPSCSAAEIRPGVTSMIRACGAIRAATPWHAATKPSSRP